MSDNLEPGKNRGGDADDEGHPEVEVIDLNTNREKKFRAKWDDTLQVVWDLAYKKLDEPRRERDRLECRKDGSSLMSYLGLTLDQMREKHICPDRKYQITGGTGGA